MAVVKTYAALGMRAAGIKLIGPGDIVQDIMLQGMGDAAVGLITVGHYSADLDNPQNNAFVVGWKAAYGADSTPDLIAVGAYDGMAAVAHAVHATKGQMDGSAAVKSLLGWKYASARGPIMIDPQTRDVVMNEYLRQVVKGSDGKLHEKVLETFHDVKDQCKALAIGPCATKRYSSGRTPGYRRRPPRRSSWMTSDMKVIVISGGIDGLSTALSLHQAGIVVRVLRSYRRTWRRHQLAVPRGSRADRTRLGRRTGAHRCSEYEAVASPWRGR